MNWIAKIRPQIFLAIVILGVIAVYALRVGYYSDNQKAENIKRRIRSRLGLTNLEIIELK